MTCIHPTTNIYTQCTYVFLCCVYTSSYSRWLAHLIRQIMLHYNNRHKHYLNIHQYIYQMSLLLLYHNSYIQPTNQYWCKLFDSRVRPLTSMQFKTVVTTTTILTASYSDSLHNNNLSCTGLAGFTDTQPSMLPGISWKRNVRSKFWWFRSRAIRITYRISLRSSSLWEPRHPLLKVVLH